MPSEALEYRPSTRDTLQAAAARLAAVPDGSPRLEAELLLAHVTGWSRTQMLAWPERPLDPSAHDAFQALLARRLAGEPVAYLRGEQAFWTFELKVTPDTLIPRPETELLVETALALLPAAELRVVDLGTGSGAIAAAVATERPAWRVIATDYSAGALAVAVENFTGLELASVNPIRCDWLRAFADDAFDAILSNPPYIEDSDPHLAKGDLRFEPRSALTPGGDGLDAIRAIAANAPRCLRNNGLVVVEHGFEQGPAVRRIFEAAGLQRTETRQDLAGLDRITLAYG